MYLDLTKKIFLDENTISARLAVFAQCCIVNDMKEELFIITTLLTTTEGTNIRTVVKNSFTENEIDLSKIVSITTDANQR